MLFQCAESALESVIGDLSHTYFVGNAPMGHIATPPSEKNKDNSSFKVCELWVLFVGFLVCSSLL